MLVIFHCARHAHPLALCAKLLALSSIAKFFVRLRHTRVCIDFAWWIRTTPFTEKRIHKDVLPRDLLSSCESFCILCEYGPRYIIATSSVQKNPIQTQFEKVFCILLFMAEIYAKLLSIIHLESLWLEVPWEGRLMCINWMLDNDKRHITALVDMDYSFQ